MTVPADAKVFINGLATKSTGERRQYSCTGLEPSGQYNFLVRSEYTRDGKPISEEKTVQLTAGTNGLARIGCRARCPGRRSHRRRSVKSLHCSINMRDLGGLNRQRT